MQKKTLIVSGLQIFPPESGGQVRSANLAKSLRDLGHEVEIFSLTGRKQDYLKGIPSAQGHTEAGLKEYVYRGKFFAILQFISYRLKMPPIWVTYFGALLRPGLLKKKMAQADLLILDFPFLHSLADRDFVLNTHNAEYELYPRHSWKSKWVKSIETTAFKRARKILFCHKADQLKFEILKDELAEKSAIVPNGVSLADFNMDTEVRKRVRAELGLTDDHQIFLFTGSQYLPNVEAFEFLRQFVQQHGQTLRQKKIVILVAGTVCREVSRSEEFIVLGRVERMLDYFFASDYGINPVEQGSGTNVKMIEYLAAKLPILTCSFGARGLDLVDGVEAVIFERNTLLEKLILMSQMDKQVKDEMARKALEKNITSVEMKQALKELVLFG